MPAGIIIYNDFDTVLIDENYSNMVVVSSGSANATDLGYEMETAYGAPLPFTPASGEKVALRSAEYSTLIGNMIYTSAPGTVYWYCFGPPPTAGAGTAGLQVYNAAGKLTFDSSQKQARVRGSITGTLTALPSATYDTGRLYAVIHSRRGMRSLRKRYVDPYGAGPYHERLYFSTAARQNGAAIQFAEILSSSTQTFSADWISANVLAHIIDVTGY